MNRTDQTTPAAGATATSAKVLTAVFSVKNEKHF